MKLKIICLNIWLGGKRFDAMIDFLRIEDADIVMMQEVFDGDDETPERRFRAARELPKLLNYNEYDFDRCFTHQTDFGTVDIGNMILSKLPITARQSHYLGGEDGIFEDIPENFARFQHRLQHVTLGASGRPLNICNFQGVWDIDGDNNSPERLQMSQAILAALQGQPNIVLGGDTNAKPTTRAIQDIEAQLTNVFKDELTTSFNLRHKDLDKFPGYATAVVDMLFTSPSIEVVGHRSSDADISDHVPLIIEINI